MSGQFRFSLFSLIVLVMSIGIWTTIATALIASNQCWWAIRGTEFSSPVSIICVSAAMSAMTTLHHWSKNESRHQTAILFLRIAAHCCILMAAVSAFSMVSLSMTSIHHKKYSADVMVMLGGVFLAFIFFLVSSHLRKQSVSAEPIDRSKP